MLNIEDLAREGFKIENGILYDKYGSYVEGPIRVREFGWERPCTEYHFDDYSLSEYTIRKEVQYDRWYLKKGYQNIVELKYYGGMNWITV